METRTLARQLTEGVASARRSARFCVNGHLANIEPGIHVAGLGPLKLPLASAATRRLISVSQQAPYGKGTQTLVNKKVRNSFELKPARFSLTNPEWDEAIRATVHDVADKLGLPADRLEPQLYKLLLYGVGGFFLPHRDSEKRDRMVGSLIVALPTPFGGGELTVRHQHSKHHIDFKEAAAGQAPCYAAFYADCEHEVSRVTRGVRLCLTYNLVLRAAKRGSKSSAPAAASNRANELATAIGGWVASENAEPLVFALDHHYTQRGLAPDLLKGSDRATVDLVIAAAEQADCRAYLCQVSRHIQQYADDGGGGRWRSFESEPEDIELGEVYEDDLHGDKWVDASGKRQPFPAIDFCATSIVASTPIDQWKPTQEEYEGFTGNAGNTMDRWYQRSAVCVWHRNQHFDVLARAQIEFAIDMLAGMVGKLKKTPKKRFDNARGECIRLARAIIRQWPKSFPRHHYELVTDDEKTRSKLPALLAEIDDPDSTRLLLARAAERDHNLELDKLVVAACRAHGCETFASELAALFETKAEGNNDGVYARNFIWLERLASARLDDAANAAVIGRLGRLAAAQFCQPFSARHHYREAPRNADRTLPALLCALVISGDDKSLQEVVRFVRSQPEQFSVQAVQVPSLERVVAWSRKRRAGIHPLVLKWLQSLQNELSTATAQEPEPHTDWARPAEVACSCGHCKQLNEFLSDPAAETGRIRAADYARSHAIQAIDRHRCDVTHKLEKKGSPYTLVLTKTNGSFKRRVERYRADRALLKTVVGLLKSHADK